MHDPTYALHVRFITPERCFDSLPFLLPCISPCPCPTRGASIFSASRSTKTGFETRHRCCRLVTAFHLLPSCKRTLILFPERKARRTLPKLFFVGSASEHSRRFSRRSQSSSCSHCASCDGPGMRRQSAGGNESAGRLHGVRLHYSASRRSYLHPNGEESLSA